MNHDFSKFKFFRVMNSRVSLRVTKFQNQWLLFQPNNRNSFELDLIKQLQLSQEKKKKEEKVTFTRSMIGTQANAMSKKEV